jgi:hypothetical protein
MRTTLRCTAIGALAGAAVVLAVPAVASAAAAPTVASPAVPSAATAPSTAGLAAVQAKAAAAISVRLTALNQTIPTVNANTVITSADKATLITTLTGDVNGLTGLGHTIAADTTTKQAQTDAATIYTGYRVFALALPQVRYAEAADDLTGGVLPKLTDAQTELTTLLAGVEAPKDTAAVQATMTDLAARISAATSATTGMAATVLAYTPAQYDADHALLDRPRQNLVTAGADAKAASADVTTVLGELQ